MRPLQLLGIWAIGGFSEPKEKDLSNWTKRIGNVLEDPNGLFFFGECLKGPKKRAILELWIKCNKFIKG